MNRDNCRLHIAGVIKDFKKEGIVALDINIDQYLDFLDELVKGFDWKKSNWADRIKFIWNIGDITIDFYKDTLDETNEQIEEAYVEIATAGWYYLKKKFDIKLPILVAPFEGKIVQTLVSAAVKFALSKLKK